MTFLRIILFAVLLYYGIKLCVAWIFGAGKKRVKVSRSRRSKNADDRYGDLTDQRIEDADYEEIDTEERL